jgi:hypothetical protein
MTLIRKKFELVPSGVFRSFWTLQDRLNAFSYKKKKKKRLQLSVQKAEQIFKESFSELRNELQRKDLLAQKDLTKLKIGNRCWKTTCSTRSQLTFLWAPSPTSSSHPPRSLLL